MQAPLTSTESGRRSPYLELPTLGSSAGEPLHGLLLPAAYDDHALHALHVPAKSGSGL